MVNTARLDVVDVDDGAGPNFVVAVEFTGVAGDAGSEVMERADPVVAAVVSSATRFAGEPSLLALQPTAASVPMAAAIRTRTIGIMPIWYWRLKARPVAPFWAPPLVQRSAPLSWFSF